METIKKLSIEVKNKSIDLLTTNNKYIYINIYIINMYGIEMILLK